MCFARSWAGVTQEVLLFPEIADSPIQPAGLLRFDREQMRRHPRKNDRGGASSHGRFPQIIDDLLEDNEIHAAVLCPACICRVRGNGLGFAKAHLVETVGIDALGLQVVEHGLSPSVAQRLVIRWGPNRVGAALELNHHIRVDTTVGTMTDPLFIARQT